MILIALAVRIFFGHIRYRFQGCHVTCLQSFATLKFVLISLKPVTCNLKPNNPLYLRNANNQ